MRIRLRGNTPKSQAGQTAKRCLPRFSFVVTRQEPGTQTLVQVFMILDIY